MLKALMKSHMQWKIYFSFFLLGLIMAFAQVPFNFSFITPITMSDEVKARVDAMWDELGIDKR